MLEACVFATILIGFFGILLKQNLMMKIIAMDVMSTGVVAYYVLIAARSGNRTPIVSEAFSEAFSEVFTGAFSGELLRAQTVGQSAYADPVPQAVILTAIVIGFSIQALMLVGVMKLSQEHPTLECADIEQNNTP